MRRLKFYSGVVSDTGQHRPQNEDAYALPLARRTKSAHPRGYHYPLVKDDVERGALFLVADGVGGSDAGQVASLATVRAVVDAYYASKVVRRDLALERAISQANEEIYTEATATGLTASTTLVGLLLLQERAFALNIGDSRAYLLRQGQIERLTQDHSLREELLHNGDVAPEDGVTIPEHIITRSVGRAPAVTPDIFEVAVEPDDQFLLCSDGLTRHVTEDELLALSTQARDPQQAAEALSALANERGGKDNITVLVIRLKRGIPTHLLYAVLRLVALLILLAGLVWVVWRMIEPQPLGGAVEWDGANYSLFSPDIIVGGEDTYG